MLRGKISKTSSCPFQSEEVISFALLVFPEFPMMAFNAVIEPLRAANRIAGRQLYSWITVAEEAERVAASNGVWLEPDFAARQAPPVNRIVVCSGGNADLLVANDALAWIRRSLRKGAHLGAVADAAFLLARAGLLDDFACTLHWMSQPAFREAFPHLEMRRDLYVIDRQRFTSAGGVAGLDMMLELIATDYGGALAAGVAEWFVHSPLRPGIDRRLMPLRLRTGIKDELVLAAVGLMEDRLEERLTVEQLAQELKVSLDKLERAFQREVSTSPSRYYRSLRLRRARYLLAHSSLPVNEVALACGFADPSSFARAFKEHFGLTPRSLRNVSRDHPSPLASLQ